MLLYIWRAENLRNANEAEREAKQTEKNAARLIAKMIRAPTDEEKLAIAKDAAASIRADKVHTD